MKLLEHGGRMASEYSGIISALEMLQIIDYYSNVMQQDDLAPYVFGILDVLAARKLPANQVAIYALLSFSTRSDYRVIFSKVISSASPLIAALEFNIMIAFEGKIINSEREADKFEIYLYPLFSNRYSDLFVIA